MTQVADFATYTKFFVSLFALINPVGIMPVFISMTADQPPSVSNRINLTASITVAVILWTALFLGDGVLTAFGVSVDSFRIAGGVLVCSIAMTMVSGKLGEQKLNKQEKSETVQPSIVTANMGVVPLALPLMAGPGAISSTIVWGTKYNNWESLIGFSVASALFACCCWLLYRIAPFLVRVLGQTGINVITRIMGLLLMALGIEFIVTSLRNLFPALV